MGSNLEEEVIVSNLEEEAIGSNLEEEANGAPKVKFHCPSQRYSLVTLSLVNRFWCTTGNCNCLLKSLEYFLFFLRGVTLGL